MRKRFVIAAGVMGMMVLAGCQNAGSSETEQLKQQIAQLEQQVTELENSSNAGAAEDTADAFTDTAGNESAAEASNGNTASTDNTAAADTGTQSTAGTTAVPTIDELTEKVNAFVAKADAEAASSAQKDLENFFTLKQEADGIDRELEYYEDDLEFQYRNGSLTRDDYRAKERELDLLEDKLDAAEDTLEYVYGIDD